MSQGGGRGVPVNTVDVDDQATLDSEVTFTSNSLFAPSLYPAVSQATANTNGGSNTNTSDPQQLANIPENGSQTTAAETEATPPTSAINRMATNVRNFWQSRFDDESVTAGTTTDPPPQEQRLVADASSSDPFLGAAEGKNETKGVGRGSSNSLQPSEDPEAYWSQKFDEDSDAEDNKNGADTASKKSEKKKKDNLPVASGILLTSAAKASEAIIPKEGAIPAGQTATFVGVQTQPHQAAKLVDDMNIQKGVAVKGIQKDQKGAGVGVGVALGVGLALPASKKADESPIKKKGNVPPPGGALAPATSDEPSPPEGTAAANGTDVGMTSLARGRNVPNSANHPGAFSMAGVAGARPPEESSSSEETDSEEEEILQSNNNGLAVAAPVTEEARRDLENAQPVTLDDIAERERSQLEKKKQTQFQFTIGALMAIALVIFFIIFAVVQSEKDDAPAGDVTAEQANATSVAGPPKARPDILAALLPNSTLARTQIDGTPQADAFRWVAQDPNFDLYSDKRLQQRFALATFWYSTNGEEWGPDWLNVSQHECYWDTFMGTNIQYLRFGMRNSEFQIINGTCAPIGTAVLNASDVTAATSLEHDDFLYLAMYEQDLLRGELPPEIEMLTSLKIIQMFATSLDSSIPPFLTRMSWLHDLILSTTLMTGTVPTEIGLMTELRSLEIGSFGLTGTLPSEVGLLTNLKTLQVVDHNITGPIPSECSNLVNLLDFYLNGGLFTGTIPTELALMTKLEWFMLFGNQLTGTIPSELAALEDVWLFYFERNKLTGTIPTEYGTIKGIEEARFIRPHEGQFRAAHNMLTGSIPTELGQASMLWRLYLNDNYLTGPIPTELGRIQNIERMYLQNNMLTGTLPTEMTPYRDLKRFDISNNHLSGSLPFEWHTWVRMWYFHINDNSFTGTIPPRYHNMSWVQVMHLQNNRFSGQIPSEFGWRMFRIKELNLGSNSFSGTIPEELGSFANSTFNNAFKILNLTDNNFSGTIPELFCDWADPELFNVLQFDCGPVCGCDCPCSNLSEVSNDTATLVIIPPVETQVAVAQARDGAL